MPGKVVTSHPVIDEVLESHGKALGSAASDYRHHVYRGLNYQLRLLGQREPTDGLALAWAVHDLGIWTAGTFDYLPPSAELAARHADEVSAEELPQVVAMVESHHKIRPVRDRLVESFRRADRIDVLRGGLRGPLSRHDIEQITRALPYGGFHAFLLRAGLGYAVRHPRRPFPMMRW
ncbi:hypothetical protein ACGFNU_32820 [Spirillospora sp. NPDC048911]|uniref:hypothetical protein n=1 Tax=Spirillospora sp. NPDC048911 TaxID=3364527 RepID=UPI0037193BB3